jgi:hypothetical protein
MKAGLILLMALGYLLFYTNKERVYTYKEKAGPKRNIASQPIIAYQNQPIQSEEKQVSEKRTAQSVTEKRVINARTPADVSKFKKHIRRMDLNAVVRRNVLENKLFKFGTISISRTLRAEPLNTAKIKHSDVLGEINGLVIFSESPKAELRSGQFLVAYDHAKNSVAFFTGRLILQTSAAFNENLLKNLNFQVSEKSNSDVSLSFVEYLGDFSEMERDQRILFKLEGVSSVRAELVYGRKSRQ